jgi:hypothetical protein
MSPTELGLQVDSDGGGDSSTARRWCRTEPGAPSTSCGLRTDVMLRASRHTHPLRDRLCRSDRLHPHRHGRRQHAGDLANGVRGKTRDGSGRSTTSHRLGRSRIGPASTTITSSDATPSSPTRFTSSLATGCATRSDAVVHNADLSPPGPHPLPALPHPQAPPQPAQNASTDAARTGSWVCASVPQRRGARRLAGQRSVRDVYLTAIPTRRRAHRQAIMLGGGSAPKTTSKRSALSTHLARGAPSILEHHHTAPATATEGLNLC